MDGKKPNHGCMSHVCHIAFLSFFLSSFISEGPYSIPYWALVKILISPQPAHFFCLCQAQLKRLALQ